MRKNSSKASNKPKKTPAPNGRARSSTAPPKAKPVSKTASTVSAARKTSTKNTPEQANWKDDPQLNAMMEEVFFWKNQEKYPETVEALKKVVRAYPAYPGAHGLLGAILFHHLDEPKKALPSCRRAVKLSPKSEMASLGLFHVLWKLDRRYDALEEMKRYQVLTNFKCQDYREIIAELNADEEAPPKAKSPRPKSPHGKVSHE